MTLSITYSPTADLIPAATNAKLHTEAQVSQIAASIREFGFNNPVLVEPDGTNIAGHGRVLAAGKLGIEADPGDVLYLCGVSAPYVWMRNFHLALVCQYGARVRTTAYTGDVIEIDGCDLIHFDDAEARRRFPDKGEAFLSCRNFQFGAHHFRE